MFIQDHFDLPSWFPNSGCTLRCGWVEIVWYWEQTSERIFEKNLGKLEDVMCTHKGKYFYSYIIVSTRIWGEYLKAEINRILSKVWTLSRLIWFSPPCQTLTFAQKGNSVCVCAKDLNASGSSQSGKIEIQDTFYRFSYLCSDLKSGEVILNWFISAQYYWEINVVIAAIEYTFTFFPDMEAGKLLQRGRWGLIHIFSRGSRDERQVREGKQKYSKGMKTYKIPKLYFFSKNVLCSLYSWK